MLILLFSSFAFLSGKEISNFETLRHKLEKAQAGFQFDIHRDDSAEGTCRRGILSQIGPTYWSFFKLVVFTVDFIRSLQLKI